MTDTRPDIDLILHALRETAVARDARGGHAADEKALLQQAGLLRLSVPRALGGEEWPWQRLYRLTRQIATVDSALAHVFAFHHLQVATVLIYGNAEQQARLLAPVLERGDWWGNAINPRDTRLVATPATGGGYLLSGEKSFCSGIVGAAIMTLTAHEAATGQPLIAVLPTHHPGITILEDWDPIGQRQTDSNSVRFEQVPLSAQDVLIAPGQAPTPFNTLRNCLAQLVLVNLYLGLAQGAFDEARRFVQTRGRPWMASSATKAVDDPFTQNRFGEMRAAIAPAAALADLAAKQVDDAYLKGHALSAADRAEAAVTVAEAKIAAHRAALYVTQELFEATGASGTRRGFGLDRFWRNARTHTLHDPIDYKLNMLGRWVLTGEPPDPRRYA